MTERILLTPSTKYMLVEKIKSNTGYQKKNYFMSNYKRNFILPYLNHLEIKHKGQRQY